MNNSDDPGGQSFLEYIGENYYNEKAKLEKICQRYNNMLFDEDIFHDTIIKVSESLKSRCLMSKAYDAYMEKSFRTNLIREMLYHRNSKTDHGFNFDIIQPYTDSYIESVIDFDMVIEIMNNSFGKSLTLFYIDWLSGYDIKEAMKRHDVKSGYYHIKRMTNFIRNYNINGKMIY